MWMALTPTHARLHRVWEKERESARTVRCVVADNGKHRATAEQISSTNESQATATTMQHECERVSHIIQHTNAVHIRNHPLDTDSDSCLFRLSPFWMLLLLCCAVQYILHPYECYCSFLSVRARLSTIFGSCVCSHTYRWLARAPLYLMFAYAQLYKTLNTISARYIFTRFILVFSSFPTNFSVAFVLF